MNNQPQPSGKWNNALVTEPAEEGVYFIKTAAHRVWSQRYSYWDGKQWMIVCDTIQDALEQTLNSIEMYCPTYPREWCGVK